MILETLSQKRENILGRVSMSLISREQCELQNLD